MGFQRLFADGGHVVGRGPLGRDRSRFHLRCRRWANALLLGLVLIGCNDSEPDVSLPDPLTTGGHRGDAARSLSQAFDFLERLEEFDQATAHREILKNLNEWARQETFDENWRPDLLIEQLPGAYSALVTPDSLAKSQYDSFDALVLQEAVWMRDAAQAVLHQDRTSPEVEQLIEQLADSAPSDHAIDLAHALRLFDWTVRNLQLDAPVRPGEDGRFGSDVILYAWEALLFGRGTLEEKSRVFILLCRQIGLPVVMLAVDRDQELAIWQPALLLDDQLYLFDMRLGVPVPGPDRRGIATLEQVIEDPALLGRLESLPDYPYPISTEDLENVVGLIDATPPELSQRMHVLERALVDDDKLILTVSPTTIATGLAECEGMQGAGIWTHSYDSFVIRSRLQQDSEAVMRLAFEHQLFQRQSHLAQGRILHLRGVLEDRDDRPGAQTYYLECRTPEAQIDSIRNLPVPTPDEGMPPDANALERHAENMAVVQRMMRRTKDSASYWLGLAAFDRGQYATSIDWLEKRLLEVSPSTQWSVGAHYNLGRAYEARGRVTHSTEDLQLARKWYLKLSNRPTAAACQLRAQRLAEEFPQRDEASVPDA